MAMSNNTNPPEFPPLPPYSLKPVDALLPPIRDSYLLLALPIITYWCYGLFWYLIDQYNLLSKYRIHTPAEFLQRNRVSAADVAINVLSQQILTTTLGVFMVGEPDQCGREAHDQAVLARKLRLVQRAVPNILAVAGIDSKSWANSLAGKYPAIASILNGGGRYLTSKQQPPNTLDALVPTFEGWELFCSYLLYWYMIPACQFAVAIFVADSWQYFSHRIMHKVPWLYTNFHSIHHRVYVPYAFGAFYASILEAFAFDTIGMAVALQVSGLTTRQSMWFLTLSTLKSLDDHCGYDLPWDPFQWLGPQNVLYHDIHHQSFGIKTNFAQVYTTFWDHALGSVYKGDDLTARYERGRASAETWAAEVQKPDYADDRRLCENLEDD